MVRNRRSISKEDASSVLADSGISLSSPPTNLNHYVHLKEEEEEALLGLLCETDDENEPEIIENETVENVIISDTEEDSDDDDHSLDSEKCKSVNIAKSAKPRVKRSRKAYICDICQKEFGGNSDLKRHKFIHTAEKPFSCETCNKSYRQEINLKNHITAAHKKEKQFACTVCSKKFALKERLRLHMRLHTGEKPYACQQCDKRFARGGQLHQHMVTHHNDAEKQFKCEICATGFSTPSNLKAHMQAHNETPDCVCDLCKESFPNDVLLKAHVHKEHYKLEQLDCDICSKTLEGEDFPHHMRIYHSIKMHVCEICNTMFTQKSQYNVHLRMHTGERPFQCRLCCQTFAHSSVLKLHIRKHTGEKPFQCLLCKDEVAFSQLAHLKTHMKKIHKQLNSYMCEGCHDFFKMKIDLESHQNTCKNYTTNVGQQDAQNNDSQTLSNLRFLMAILLKKISSEQKLQQLGFEKRLIDNVVIASLKVASRKTYEDTNLSSLERMRLNVEEFLNWTVPQPIMDKIKGDKLTTEDILEKIVSMYLKQK